MPVALCQLQRPLAGGVLGEHLGAQCEAAAADRAKAIGHQSGTHAPAAAAERTLARSRSCVRAVESRFGGAIFARAKRGGVQQQCVGFPAAWLAERDSRTLYHGCLGATVESTYEASLWIWSVASISHPAKYALSQLPHMHHTAPHVRDFRP